MKEILLQAAAKVKELASAYPEPEIETSYQKITAIVVFFQTRNQSK